MSGATGGHSQTLASAFADARQLGVQTWLLFPAAMGPVLEQAGLLGAVGTPLAEVAGPAPGR